MCEFLKDFFVYFESYQIYIVGFVVVIYVGEDYFYYFVIFLLGVWFKEEGIFVMYGVDIRVFIKCICEEGSMFGCMLL